MSGDESCGRYEHTFVQQENTINTPPPIQPHNQLIESTRSSAQEMRMRPMRPCVRTASTNFPSHNFYKISSIN